MGVVAARLGSGDRGISVGVEGLIVDIGEHALRNIQSQRTALRTRRRACMGYLLSLNQYTARRKKVPQWGSEN
jgi:hypothetical protein